jgi:hypothetical protein
MKVKAVKYGRANGRRLLLGTLLNLREKDAQPLLKRGIVVRLQAQAKSESEFVEPQRPIQDSPTLAGSRVANLSEALNQIQPPDRHSSKLQSEWLHVLAPGTWPGQHGTITLSSEDLRTIAATYDPSVHEAPVVIGHPITDDPAWGWVHSLEVRPDGLWANAGLQPELSDLVHRQMYRKISVSLYPPHAGSNPMPGRYYLKHVGFLGAQAPAVKGLKPIALQALDETISLQFKL